KFGFAANSLPPCLRGRSRFGAAKARPFPIGWEYMFRTPTRIAAGARDLSRRNVSSAQKRPQNSKASTLRSMRARDSTERSKPATEAALCLGSTATEDGSFAHQHPCGLKCALLRSHGEGPALA